MTEEIQNKIVLLNDEGLTAGKIAQKLKVKKTVVLEVLGTNVNGGLGSAIESITEATGIKAVVEAVTDDCGCKARAEKLNKLFPTRKLNDLLDAQYSFLETFFEGKRVTSVNSKLQKQLVDVYNHVFNAKREVSACSPCVANLISDLKKIYEGANN